MKDLQAAASILLLLQRESRDDNRGHQLEITQDGSAFTDTMRDRADYFFIMNSFDVDRASCARTICAQIFLACATLSGVKIARRNFAKRAYSARKGLVFDHWSTRRRSRWGPARGPRL